VTTPFVESFDTTLDNPPENPHLSMEDAEKRPVKFLRHLPSQLVYGGAPEPTLPYMHGIKSQDLQEVIEHAKELTLPVVQGTDTIGMEKARLELDNYAEGHARAERAVQRILNLANGNARDKLRVNVDRCVEKFGRHNTDPQLPARPNNRNAAHEEKMRGGPDTGSAEVQIGILTVKIRALADALSHKSTKDKHNKRNLRLLVHRRQKLLKYLKRKERGGPRWQHCIQTLGLTPGTWEGEISL
jgi:ribosomal protein S15